MGLIADRRENSPLENYETHGQRRPRPLRSRRRAQAYVDGISGKVHHPQRDQSGGGDVCVPAEAVLCRDPLRTIAMWWSLRKRARVDCVAHHPDGGLEHRPRRVEGRGNEKADPHHQRTNWANWAADSGALTSMKKARRPHPPGEQRRGRRGGHERQKISDRFAAIEKPNWIRPRLKNL